jgi:uncharacterized protein (DUF305 family)
MSLRPITLCLALLALAAPAYAQSSGGAPMPASPADKSMMSGMDQMNKAMGDAPMTGNADHDFVAMMIPHHQGAMAMAQTELQYGHDPAMRRLARQIIAAQHQEIGEMKAWQAAHQAP